MTNTAMRSETLKMMPDSHLSFQHLLTNSPEIYSPAFEIKQQYLYPPTL